MPVQIYPISFGFVSAFLLKGEQSILIDAGTPGQKERLLKGLAAAHTRPDEIDLLLFTHGHYDHIGLAKEIVALSGARTAIHAREKEWLESGIAPTPPRSSTWGKILASITRFLPEMQVPATKADIILEDEGLLLHEFGIPGKVVYTPGHTMGSTSVLLDNGAAIVGDLAMSAKYMRRSPGFPIFAENPDLVLQSWQKLLDLGAKTIYPAHGNPFSAEIFRQQH